MDEPKHNNGNIEGTPPVEPSKRVEENPTTKLVTPVPIGFQHVEENLPTTLAKALPAIIDKLVEHKKLIIHPFWVLAFLSIFDKTWREDIKHLFMWIVDITICLFNGLWGLVT